MTEISAKSVRLVVAHRIPVARDVVELVLAHPESGPLPQVSPGAHVLVRLSPDLARQYSLCNGPEETDVLRIAVKRESNGRGGSRAMHMLAPGDSVVAEFPSNMFALEPAEHTVLFAAGIGITPIISMVQSLSAASRPFTLFYSARDEASAPFVDLLRRPPYAPYTHIHFSSKHGRLDPADALQRVPHGSRLYTCGPSGFMDQVLSTARKMGWPADRLHQEYFSGNTPALAGAAFKVVLAKTGCELIVGDDENLVNACKRAGCDIPTSCEQGVCGTCLVSVLNGEPDHRDLFLTDAERLSNSMMLACCSRAKTAELVLDL